MRYDIRPFSISHSNHRACLGSTWAKMANSWQSWNAETRLLNCKCYQQLAPSSAVCRHAFVKMVATNCQLPVQVQSHSNSLSITRLVGKLTFNILRIYQHPSADGTGPPIPGVRHSRGRALGLGLGLRLGGPREWRTGIVQTAYFTRRLATINRLHVSICVKKFILYS